MSVSNPNVNSASTTLSTEGTIYHDLTENEVQSYYSTLDTSLKGDSLLENLQTILSKNQQKVNYSSGDTTSKSRHGYYLVERDFDLSPLEESELSGNYKVSGIRINILYSDSPLYIETSINNGNFKYMDGEETIEGKFVQNSIGLDREHVLPKSYGFNGPKSDSYKNYTAGCDMHNLHAGETNGNQDGHSNYPFGEIANKSSSTAITSSITKKTIGYVGNDSYGNKVFEPLDENKGEIARSVFYMAARYHTYEKISDTDESPSIRLADNTSAITTMTPSQTKDNPVKTGQLSALLSWNKAYPVTDKEIHRNNLVYNAIQYNRNPFIDYPSWADVCFSDSSDSSISLANPSQVGNSSNPTDDPVVDPTDDPTIDTSTYTLTLEGNSNFKTKYNQLEKIEFKNLETTLLKDGEKINLENITYYLDDEVIDDSFTVLGFGEHKLKVTTTIDDKVYTSNELALTFGISMIQAIILAAIVLIIILLFVSISIYNGRKKKRKNKKNSAKTANKKPTSSKSKK